MKKIFGSAALVLAMMTAAPARAADEWVDGVTTYKVNGVDTHFPNPADACKASADDLTRHGNKKTYESFKEGTQSTMMTCILRETDGSRFDQTNQVSKILECPDTTSPRSTDNSGEFSKMRCHCNDAEKGCPASAKK